MIGGQHKWNAESTLAAPTSKNNQQLDSTEPNVPTEKLLDSLNGHHSKHKHTRQTQTSYRPMITFAPEHTSPKNQGLRSIHQYAYDDARDTVEPKMASAQSNNLPFEFMPNVGTKDGDIKPNLTAELFNTILRFAGGIIARLMIFTIQAFSEKEAATAEPLCISKPSHSLKRKSFRKRKTPVRSSKRSMGSPKRPRTPQQSHSSSSRSCFVKNPKDFLHVVPSGWEKLFELQIGEWRCNSCHYKNPADAFTCDDCLAVKNDGNAAIAKSGEYYSSSNDSEEDISSAKSCSPSAMSCDSSVSPAKNEVVQDGVALNDIEPDNTAAEIEEDKHSSMSGTNRAKRHDEVQLSQNESSKRPKDNVTENTDDLKKRASDHENDEFQSKRLVPAEHESMGFRRSQAQITNKKRSQEFNGEDDGVPVKRLGIDSDEQKEHEDLMEISPNKV